MNDKVVLITGAAQGIGESIAVKFASEGAKVAIFDIIEPKKTIKKIEESNGKVLWMQVDITNEKIVKESIDLVVQKFGMIDILVNNAGIFPIERFDAISSSLFRKIFEINVFGLFNCSQNVVKLFISNKIPGRIINIASAEGIREAPYQTAYSASKAAVISLTKGMAIELAKHGILVNAIAPGAIVTKGAKTAVPFPETGNFPEDFMEYQKKKFSPLGRMGKPEDIAEMAFFLASDKANYLTGSIISVDGGRTLI
ncbi:MAG: SDR family oxidoreductase [Candidatus Lokiarchaeota archaeon]|nr:SDR family oxidoreductase [Candidatus Lokiarchaeota archaeon]